MIKLLKIKFFKFFVYLGTTDTLLFGGFLIFFSHFFMLDSCQIMLRK